MTMTTALQWLGTAPRIGQARPRARRVPGRRLPRLSPIPGSPLALLLAGLATFLSIPSLCRADASADISNKNWFYKNSNTSSDSVWAGTLGWASNAQMFWTFGPNQINTTGFAATGATEPKFTVPATGLPAARVFTGFTGTSTLTPAKFITGTGSGSSSVGVVWYGAKWSVTVTQTGLANPPDSWKAKIVGNDPWDIYASDLKNVTGKTYSLYMPLNILGGSSSMSTPTSKSGYDINLTYTTASGTSTLLDVSVVGNKATVTPSSQYSSSQLQFFLQSGPDVTPYGSSSTPGTEISAGALGTLVNQDIGPDLKLKSPIYLGVVLNGVDTPTTPLYAGGPVGDVGYSSSAFISAVPEPPSVVLGVLGLISVVAIPLRRRLSRNGKRGDSR
jgi:hypothetical protein